MGKSKSDEAKEIQRIRSQLLREMSQTELKPQEKEELKMRYGLEDDQPFTLGEIAIFFNVTGEEIERVENIALRKLRRTRLSSA